MAVARRPVHFVNREGADPEGIALGLAWLQTACQNEDANSAWIVALVKDNLRGNLAPHMGRSGSTAEMALLSGRTVSFGTTGTQLQVVTERTLPYRGPGGPVLAIYPPLKMLTKLDDMQNITALAVVPWILKEVRPWIAKWQAVDVEASAPPKQTAARLSNPVVQVALDSLIVNKETGLSHPRDRNTVIWLFRILRDNHEEVDFNELPAWLIERGFTSKGADEITQAGRDIYAGKRLQAGGERPFKAGVIRSWRARAKQRSDGSE